MISKKAAWIQLFVIVGVFVFAYFPVWRDLVTAWAKSDEYSHGFLILPVSLYLVWNRKRYLERMEVGHSWWGMSLAVFSLILYLFSVFAGIETTASLSMVIFLSGAILYLFGISIFKEVMFPLAFLVFMIPVPAQIYASMTIPLQLLVSRVSVWVSSCLGVPIFHEGNLICLPDQTLQVVEACSGLRSMMMLIALAALLWHLTMKSKFLGALLMLSAVPIALSINIFRVVAVVFALWYLNFDLSRGTLHTVLGLLVNILAIMMILTFRGGLSKWDRALEDE